MLFVGSSATSTFLVDGAGTEEANGLYVRQDKGETMPPVFEGKRESLLQWKKQLAGRHWYKKDDEHIHFDVFFEEWWLCDKEGTVLYDVKSNALMPPLMGWRKVKSNSGQDPAPTLQDFTELQEKAHRIILQKFARDLPRMYMKDWFKTDVKWPKPTRRRLMSDAAGYGPHDHASTRRHIRRFLASEAAASGSAF